MRELIESSHFSRQLKNVLILTEVQGVEGGEGADAERNMSKLVVAQIQYPNGWYCHIDRQRTELIVGEI